MGMRPLLAARGGVRADGVGDAAAQRRSRGIALLSALAILGSACASNEKTSFERNGDDQGPPEESAVEERLRVDVFPSDLNADLLPETHFLSEAWEELDIQLQGPVSISGTITGYDATPYIVVPGTSVPVDGQVYAYVQDTVMSGTGVTDAESGFYELRIPARTDAEYIYAVVPTTPAELPFLVETGRSFAAGSNYIENVDLDYGAPLYGQVLLSKGDTGFEYMQLQAVESETGVAGPTTVPDETGFFMLRVQPAASYEVLLSGEEGSLVPSFSQEVEVEDEEGAEVVFELGSLESYDVSGTVSYVPDSEEPDERSGIDGATVRFTSQQLLNHPGGSLVVEDSTPNSGGFDVNLLPGRYQVEYMAPYSMDLTPQQDTIEVGTSDVDVDKVVLDSFVTVDSTVLGPEGLPVVGATVVATERSFDGNTYSTSTAKDGSFSIDLPGVKLDCAITPPEGPSAITYTECPAEAFPQSIQLEVGEVISGQVVDPNLLAVQYALLEVRDADDRLFATTFTDENGEFSVRVAWDDHNGSGGDTAESDSARLD